MSKKHLWKPVNVDTGLTKYINFLKENGLYKFTNYEKLHQWSVDKKDLFWKSVWDFTNVVGEYADPVTKNESNFLKKVYANIQIFYKNFNTINLIKKKKRNEKLKAHSSFNKFFLTFSL